MKQTFSVTPHALTLALALAGALPVTGAVILERDSATFNGLVQPGAYVENFEGYAGGFQFDAASENFSSGGFDYTIAATGGSEFNVLYINPASGPVSKSITSYEDFSSMLITFTSGNVTAAGANFYVTDFSAALQTSGSDLFTVTVNSTLGGAQVFSNEASENPPRFFGFYTTNPGDSITSILVSGSPGAQRVFAVDNLTAGAAVPEPVTTGVATAAGLLAAGTVLRLRRRAASRSA